jgi:hypothetical protein
LWRHGATTQNTFIWHLDLLPLNQLDSSASIRQQSTRSDLTSAAVFCSGYKLIPIVGLFDMACNGWYTKARAVKVMTAFQMYFRCRWQWGTVDVKRYQPWVQKLDSFAATLEASTSVTVVRSGYKLISIVGLFKAAAPRCLYSTTTQNTFIWYLDLLPLNKLDSSTSIRQQ